MTNNEDRRCDDNPGVPVEARAPLRFAGWVGEGGGGVSDDLMCSCGHGNVHLAGVEFITDQQTIEVEALGRALPRRDWTRSVQILSRPLAKVEGVFLKRQVGSEGHEEVHVHFSCESCDEGFTVIFVEHKGSVFVSQRPRHS